MLEPFLKLNFSIKNFFLAESINSSNSFDANGICSWVEGSVGAWSSPNIFRRNCLWPGSIANFCCDLYDEHEQLTVEQANVFIESVFCAPIKAWISSILCSINSDSTFSKLNIESYPQRTKMFMMHDGTVFLIFFQFLFLTLQVLFDPFWNGSS